jgi:hypothetical protein
MADYNTAVGISALGGNFTGNQNTASGAFALTLNTTGAANTASGVSAMQGNTTGSNNTAAGYVALANNSTGSYLTAMGAFALESSSTGGYDTALGAYALVSDTTGSGNSAFGYAGLRAVTTGSNNIGFGYQTLYSNSTGSNNIAMGYQGGYYVLNGSNNIEIGSLGEYADQNLIRIGTQDKQTKTFIAGVSGSQVTGSAVYVTSSGQLGVLASSERYKTAVMPMGANTGKLHQLRPVSFHLKTEPEGPVQYGLIAEQVDEVHPELVIRDARGKIQGVRYEELAPMLLNELQQQQARITAQTAEIRALKRKVAEFDELKQEMRNAVLEVRAGGGLAAQR